MSVLLSMLLGIAVLVAAFFWFRWRARIDRDLRASLPLTSAEGVVVATRGRRAFLELGRVLLFCSLVFFALALLESGLEQMSSWLFRRNQPPPLPRSGLSFYFLIDSSGSMAEKVPVSQKNGTTVDMPKIDFAKKLVEAFITGSKDAPGRPNDLIGLVTFARIGRLVCPPTLDRRALLSRLQTIEPVTSDELNGTAIGYAIFKTIQLITALTSFSEQAHSYSISHPLMIIITDGLQSPNPLDQNNPYRFMREETALAYAKENGVPTYLVAVDPIFELPQFSQEVDRITKGLRETGGDFFFASSLAPMEAILKKTEPLEKKEASIPEQPVSEQEGQHVPLFVCLALGALLLGSVAETTCARSAP